MATKHISDDLWSRIEALTVRANGTRGLLRPIREADVLSLVLQRGLDSVTDDDLSQLGQYRRPLGFVMRRRDDPVPVQLDSLSPQDVATRVQRSGPLTLCVWSIDDLLRRAAEDVLRERLPDVPLLSEGEDIHALRALLPEYWNAAIRGETAIVSLRANSAESALVRIADEMCVPLLGWQGKRAYLTDGKDEPE